MAETTSVWGDDGSLTIIQSEAKPEVKYTTGEDSQTEISVTPQDGEIIFIYGDDEGSKKVSGVSDRFDFEAKPKGYGLGLTLGYDAIFSDHFLMGIELAGFGYNVD